MIELKGVGKSFGNKYVLKDINIKLSRYGIVGICGPSGCGKSTLLNIISSLLDFEGDVIFDGKSYRTMSVGDKDEMRNSKIGFVFQDYKLFESESVKNNLLLSLDLKTLDKKTAKERKIRDLLGIIGLKHKENECVSNLSGGEKQRIAIARAILNSPKVILADEPTGNLDENNSLQIMDLLSKISSKCLVLLVSHDTNLVKRYCDQIIYLKDGSIANISYNQHNKNADQLPLIHIKPNTNKPRLPMLFAFKHAYLSISKRKWRTLFVLFTTSLGLFGVGLGTMLSDVISTNLYQSYSSIIDTNKVVVKSKNNLTDNEPIKSLDYEEVEEIYEDYRDDIQDIGVYYCNDFENMFSYAFSLDVGGVVKPLPSFTLKSLNEFDSIENIYNPLPNETTSLLNDEAMVDIDMITLNEICYQLHIPRTVKSLSEHLSMNVLKLNVNVVNNSWQYDITFPIYIRGFSLAKVNAFYHSNRRWNEYIFEECLHLPFTNQISGYSKYPWDLKKAYYFDFQKDRDVFLEDIRFERKHQYIVAEILDEKYYPNLYNNVAINKCNKVALFTKEHRDVIESFLPPIIKGNNKDITSSIFGSAYSYAIYPENLMMGFARQTYLSSSFEKSEEIIDLTAFIKYEESMNIVTPEEIIEGHFSKPSSSSLSFNPEYELMIGNKPNSYSEIVISKKIYDSLNLPNYNNQSLYLSYPIKEELLASGYLLRKYKTVELKISGVSKSEKLELSHNENWTIMFFQTMLGISSFDLTINSLALSIKDGKEENTIKDIERYFPTLEATSPIQNIKGSIDNICRYTEIVLLILSISSVIIAAILLSICNHLHFLEIQKDIGLIRCLGASKRQSSKLIYSHSILMVVLSLIFAIFELLIVCFVLMKIFSNVLAIESRFIFNPLSILYMLLVAFSVSFLSSIITHRRVNKLNPLECLQI